jgi:hypothetical protein
MYYDGLKKIARSLPYQTLFVKWGYNVYMGRNYFSKYGGPCFMNDGFSHHVKPQSQLESEEYIKPSPNLFCGLTIGFVSLILTIGIALVVIA